MSPVKKKRVKQKKSIRKTPNVFLRYVKRNLAKLIILGSAFLINIFNVLNVRLMYATAFPGELILSIAFMLGIMLGELGAAGIATKTAIFEAAGRKRDKFNLRLAWGTIFVINAFEALCIAVTSNMMLNQTIGISDSFSMLLNIGSLSGAAFSGALLSIIIGIVLPGVALAYYKVSAGIVGAEQYLRYHNELDKDGNLINPTIKLQSKTVAPVVQKEGDVAPFVTLPQEGKKLILKPTKDHKGETYTGFEISEADVLLGSKRWQLGTLYVLNDKKEQTSIVNGIPDKYLKLHFNQVDYPKDKIQVVLNE